MRRSIPRRIREAAQTALLEYLHGTRNLQFVEAEFISRNSPTFLNKLLQKVEIDNDVSHSMVRFLRYHPINEFEPFFESIGLKPNEYAPLLPRNLMFLCDDSLLLQNFRILCNHGVEWRNIGKIYTEAFQVFRYESSVLQSKLQAYHNLGVPESLVAKAVARCPRLLIGDTDEKFTQVLHMLRVLGFDGIWVELQLLEQKSCEWSSVLRVLGVFRNIGCSREELQLLLSQHPGFLFEASGSLTLSLIAFLLRFGFTVDQMHSMFLQFPKIHIRNFVSNFVKCFLLFREVEMQGEEIGKMVCSHAFLMGSSKLKKTSSILGNLNVGVRRLREHILENPEELSKLIMGAKISRLPESEDELNSRVLKNDFLLNVGYGDDPDSMKEAHKLFRGKGADLQERFDCIVEFGLDKKDVTAMVRTAPHILNHTKELLQAKLEVLVNELDYPVSALLPFPSYLSYTIPRVRLRMAMYNWLKEQGKVDPMLALSTVIASTERRYIDQYVKLDPRGPQVWKKLKREICST